MSNDIKSDVHTGGAAAIKLLATWLFMLAMDVRAEVPLGHTMVYQSVLSKAAQQSRPDTGS